MWRSEDKIHDSVGIFGGSKEEVGQGEAGANALAVLVVVLVGIESHDRIRACSTIGIALRAQVPGHEVVNALGPSALRPNQDELRSIDRAQQFHFLRAL